MAGAPRAPDDPLYKAAFLERSLTWGTLTTVLQTAFQPRSQRAETSLPVIDRGDDELLSERLLTNYQVLRGVQQRHEDRDSNGRAFLVPLRRREMPYLWAIYLTALHLHMDSLVLTRRALRTPRLVFSLPQLHLTRLAAMLHALDAHNPALRGMGFPFSQVLGISNFYRSQRVGVLEATRKRARAPAADPTGDREADAWTVIRALATPDGVTTPEMRDMYLIWDAGLLLDRRDGLCPATRRSLRHILQTQAEVPSLWHVVVPGWLRTPAVSLIKRHLNEVVYRSLPDASSLGDPERGIDVVRAALPAAWRLATAPGGAEQLVATYLLDRVAQVHHQRQGSGQDWLARLLAASPNTSHGTPGDLWASYHQQMQLLLELPRDTVRRHFGADERSLRRLDRQRLEPPSTPLALGSGVPSDATLWLRWGVPQLAVKLGDALEDLLGVDDPEKALQLARRVEQVLSGGPAPPQEWGTALLRRVETKAQDAVERYMQVRPLLEQVQIARHSGSEISPVLQGYADLLALVPGSPDEQTKSLGQQTLPCVKLGDYINELERKVTEELRKSNALEPVGRYLVEKKGQIDPHLLTGLTGVLEKLNGVVNLDGLQTPWGQMVKTVELPVLLRLATDASGKLKGAEKTFLEALAVHPVWEQGSDPLPNSSTTTLPKVLVELVQGEVRTRYDNPQPLIEKLVGYFDAHPLNLPAWRILHTIFNDDVAGPGEGPWRARPELKQVHEQRHRRFIGRLVSDLDAPRCHASRVVAALLQTTPLWEDLPPAIRKIVENALGPTPCDLMAEAPLEGELINNPLVDLQDVCAAILDPTILERLGAQGANLKDVLPSARKLVQTLSDPEKATYHKVLDELCLKLSAWARKDGPARDPGTLWPPLQYRPTMPNILQFGPVQVGLLSHGMRTVKDLVAALERLLRLTQVDADKSASRRLDSDWLDRACLETETSAIERDMCVRKALLQHGIGVSNDRKARWTTSLQLHEANLRAKQDSNVFPANDCPSLLTVLASPVFHDAYPQLLADLIPYLQGWTGYLSELHTQNGPLWPVIVSREALKGINEAVSTLAHQTAAHATQPLNDAMGGLLKSIRGLLPDDEQVFQWKDSPPSAVTPRSTSQGMIPRDAWCNPEVREILKEQEEWHPGNPVTRALCRLALGIAAVHNAWQPVAEALLGQCRAGPDIQKGPEEAAVKALLLALCDPLKKAVHVFGEVPVAKDSVICAWAMFRMLGFVVSPGSCPRWLSGRPSQLGQPLTAFTNEQTCMRRALA